LFFSFVEPKAAIKQFFFQTSEWRQFQRDLLTTVRVANDFKVDAQLDLERTVHENQGLRDRLLSLQAELDKARGMYDIWKKYQLFLCT